MKKRILALSILLIGIVSTGLCQNRTITGKIISAEDKQPVPGVTVKITGTNTGTQTNVDGQYSLEVSPEHKSLTFIMLGFEPQEIPLSDKASVDIVLKSDQKKLDEVVVVGYSVQSRKEVTGAISTIKGEAIKDMPVQSFDQALSGQAAGVNITIPNGVLNNAPVIRVRGYNSITSSSYPLVVVDGMPIFTGDQSTNSAANNPLGDINPSDIESIDVLKDASATAIYGSRASNGVLIVTTKQGKETPDGKAVVNYNAWIGITKTMNLPKLLNAEQYMTIKNEARRNAGQPDAFFPDYDANGKFIDTDWYDVVYRTGVAHNNHLSISGANPGTSYYFSVGYTHQDGIIKKNEFERKSVRFNVTQKVAKIIKIGANINYVDNLNSAPNTGSLPGQGFNTSGLGRLAFMTAPNVSPYTNTGGYNITSTNTMGLGKNTQQSGFVNPVPLLDLNTFTSASNHIISSVFAEVQIIKGLTFKTAYSVDNNTVESISFQSPVHGDGFTNKGVAINHVAKFNKWALANTLNYQKTLAENHNITALLGTETVYSVSNGWGGSRQGLADDFFESYQGNYLTNNPPVGNFQTENGFLSYFGRVTYDFKKKYFLTGSVRRDGFSGLSEGNKFGNFGGASVGWAVSQEEFFKNMALSKTINSLKLRASYGKVGNMGIGDFGALSLYSSGLYGDVNSLVYTQAGNSELKWETSTKTDFGVNVGLLQDRIQVEISYFNNDINGLILNSPQAPSKGIPGNSILLNVGSMYNKGIELSVLSTNIEKKNFSWSSNINFTYIKNEVETLADDNADIVGTTSALERTNITRVGESVGSIYAVKTAGVNPKTGQRIFVNASGAHVQYSHIVPAGQSRWTYLDGSVAPAINPAVDAVIIGSAIPKWFGGFNNTLKYKDFDMTIGIIFSGGNYIYNGSKAGMRDQRFWNNEISVMDRWTTVGQETDIPKVMYGDNVSNGSSFPISENVEKGDFAKLKNIALGYTFREKAFGKTGIQSLRLYIQASNLYTLTKYSGSDPEISTNGNSNLTPGVDRNSVAQSRTFTAGLNLVF